MSTSGTHFETIAEKIDIRKYLLVLARRKWWGVVPFVLIAAVFSVICFAVPPKYLSTCVISASKSEVAAIIGAGASPKTSLDIVKEEMLRYERVMSALAETPVLRNLESTAKGDPVVLDRLKEELYKRVEASTTISPMGATLIYVGYLGNTAEDARTVLQQLATTFVENVLRKERDDARSAKTMATNERARAKDDLDSIDNRLATFREDHPGIGQLSEGDKRGELLRVTAELDLTNRQINANRKKLDRYAEQIENEPKQIIKEVTSRPNTEVQTLRERLVDLRVQYASLLRRFTQQHPDVKNMEKDIEAVSEQLANALKEAADQDTVLQPNPTRLALEARKLELEAEIDYLVESSRSLAQRKQTLDEEVHATPGLQKELEKLLREKEIAERRLDTAVKEADRIERDYNIKVEGLVAFNIVRPPRLPQEANYRNILRLAMMGLFISLAAGAGAIAGTEFFDQSFTDVEIARDFLRLPSLGVIPFIDTPGERKRRFWKRVILLSALVTVAGLVVLAVWKLDPVARQAHYLWLQIKDLCKSIG